MSYGTLLSSNSSHLTLSNIFLIQLLHLDTLRRHRDLYDFLLSAYIGSLFCGLHGHHSIGCFYLHNILSFLFLSFFCEIVAMVFAISVTVIMHVKGVIWSQWSVGFSGVSVRGACGCMVMVNGRISTDVYTGRATFAYLDR